MGKSQGSFSTGGWNERQDFLAAVSFLKAKGFKDIGAFGFSMGGAVAIMADSPDVKAIASDSSYADLDSVLHLIFKNFGVFRYPFVWLMKLWAKLFFQIDTASVSPLKFISSTKVPVLLIHSEYDSQVPVEHVRMLRRANPRSEIWIIPESEHGRGMSSRPEEYQDRVLKFFADNKI
jgi:dipeptidyl aminopeptidase/acylaminoacyl peptidase